MENGRDQEAKEIYTALLIKKTGIHTCKDFEALLDLSEKDNYDRNSCFTNGKDEVELDLIESKHGWDFSSVFEVRINGEYEGVISANMLRDLLKERYL